MVCYEKLTVGLGCKKHKSYNRLPIAVCDLWSSDLFSQVKLESIAFENECENPLKVYVNLTTWLYPTSKSPFNSSGNLQLIELLI